MKIGDIIFSTMLSCCVGASLTAGVIWYKVNKIEKEKAVNNGRI